MNSNFMNLWDLVKFYEILWDFGWFYEFYEFYEVWEACCLQDDV